jgi:adenosylcobinamide-GDP ribazoletransferase
MSEERDAEGRPHGALPTEPEARPLLLAYLNALAAAFGFLTRLPAPRPAFDARTLARSLVWFPWVGVALGGCQVALAYSLGDSLSPMLRAVFIVALSALLTGALHLDGLADLFDGLGGGRGDRARTLEIMRDSHIGSFGALALCLVVIAKIAALEPLLAQGAWAALPALLVAPMAARTAAALLIVAFPYARELGLGSAFREHARPRHTAAAALMAVAIVVVCDAPMLLAMVVTWLLAAMFGLWIARRLGGLTGDVYGAAIELSEVVLLVLVQ